MCIVACFASILLHCVIVWCVCYVLLSVSVFCLFFCRFRIYVCSFGSFGMWNNGSSGGGGSSGNNNNDDDDDDDNHNNNYNKTETTNSKQESNTMIALQRFVLCWRPRSSMGVFIGLFSVFVGCCWLFTVFVGYCWFLLLFLLVVVGCFCWLLLVVSVVVVGCCWLFLLVVFVVVCLFYIFFDGPSSW